MNRERRHKRTDEGFTLIELMIVVLIIAILLAIAIPSFLAARTRAQDGAAQSMVRQALSTELVFYSEDTGFSDDNSDGGDLDSIEPDLAWGTLDASSRGVTATVTGPGNNTAILRSTSQAGDTFCLGRIADGASAGTYYTTGCDGTETTAAVAAWPTSAETGW